MSRRQFVRRLTVNASIVLWLTCGIVYANAQGIGVTVNGQPVSFQGIGPQQVQGRVLVPVRGVLEKLGADVQWIPQTQTVVAGNGKIDIQLKIGDRRATVNAREVILDVPAQVISGYTFVPLRFLGEALGADVRWNSQDQTVAIRTSDGQGERHDHDRDDHDRDHHDKAPHPAGPMPVINGFDQDARGWLRAGDAVHVTLDGTPGGQATFRIPGLAEAVPMREVSPGRYQGVWQVPTDRPIQTPQAAVIGSLNVDGQSSQLIQAGRPISVDTIAPQLLDNAPSPDSHVNSPRPNIYAVFTDQGSGIDPASVHLRVDGRDVTANATVNRDFISYTPSEPLPSGVQTVELTAADRAGNRTQASWKFMQDARDAGGIRAERDNGDHTLQVGNVLHVEIDGSPGGRAEFWLGNIRHIPLAEKQPGHYVADYTIHRGDDVSNAHLTVSLVTPDGARYERQSDRAITIRTGKPAAPIVTYPGTNDSPSNPLVIKGKATPNTQIHVKVDYRSKVLNVLAVQGTALDAIVQADRNGNWQTPPIALNGLLANRNVDYAITAIAVNTTNDQSDPTTSHFHLR